MSSEHHTMDKETPWICRLRRELN